MPSDLIRPGPWVIVRIYQRPVTGICFVAVAVAETDRTFMECMWKHAYSIYLKIHVLESQTAISIRSKWERKIMF